MRGMTSRIWPLYKAIPKNKRHTPANIWPKAMEKAIENTVANKAAKALPSSVDN